MHGTYQRILVPIDFSPHSTEALHHAASIAGRFFSTLLVLHVIPKAYEVYSTHVHTGRRGGLSFEPFQATLQPPHETQETVTINLREQAHSAMQKFIPTTLSYQPGELIVAIGEPYEQIIQVTNDQHIDLIVMGTHGRTGLSHAFIGSVAERVIRSASCPVLTVKATPSHSPSS
jgi:nucleotide-binding universal stress UspA family protein